MKRLIISALCAAIFSAACSRKVTNAEMVDSVPPIFPDYAGVTIPVGIAPLNFNFAGGEVDCIDVVLRGSNEGEVHVQGSVAQFDIDEWHELTAQNMGAEIEVVVSALAGGKWMQYKPFSIFVSADSLPEWGLTYRRIPPGYTAYNRMGLYQRDLSSFDETAILQNVQTGGMCINCHTSNRTNPTDFVFHVRGQHGATMIQRSGKRTWLKAKNQELGGSMVYPYWHPSGKYCAFSTNNTSQAFHTAKGERIEVYDYSSDVFVFDPETRTIITSPLLSTKEWSENVPTFSPDGRKLFFITALQRDYPLEFSQQRYNLCSIDFDPETATFGSHVDTLINAAALGKSVTWPRPSYDGRFLLFTLLDYGYFSVWHTEAEQWLMDLKNNTFRPLVEANSQRSDSYHNWSSNSRWIVFTSRRDDDLYSRLYLCHIDTAGFACKPFVLPQQNPWEFYSASLDSYNTPDFTSCRVDFDSYNAGLEILSDQREETFVRSDVVE